MPGIEHTYLLSLLYVVIIAVLQMRRLPEVSLLPSG